MLSDNELRNIDSFIDALTQRIQQFPRQFQHCSLQAITRGSELLFCLVRLGIVPKRKSEGLNYGKIQLREETFSCEDFISRLREMKEFGGFAAGDIRLPINVSSFWVGQSFFPSHSQYHDWPGHLYELGSSDSHYLNNEPLVAGGLTPYFDAQDAITHWIGIAIGNHNSGVGRLSVFLPRFDAKLDKMEFSDGILEVHCTVANPDLHLAILAVDAKATFRATTPLLETQRVKLLPNPEKLRVFIVDSQSEILDDFSETEQGASRERVIFAGARYSTELLDMIQRGETDTVEFKEFIRLDDTKDKKADDIVKAVGSGAVYFSTGREPFVSRLTLAILLISVRDFRFTTKRPRRNGAKKNSRSGV